MELAHIRSGAIVRRFNEAKGWITLEDGRMASPPVAGFVDGNDKIVVVEAETTDTSTGPDRVVSHTTTVEADRVLDATVIRDMTAQEISNRNTADADRAEASVFTDNRTLLAIMLTMRDALKAVRDGQLNGLTDAQLTNQLKTRFRANYEASQ